MVAKQTGVLREEQKIQFQACDWSIEAGSLFSLVKPYSLLIFWCALVCAIVNLEKLVRLTKLVLMDGATLHLVP